MPCGMWGLHSPTRDQACAPAVEAQSLHHWTTREVPWLALCRWNSCTRPLRNLTTLSLCGQPANLWLCREESDFLPHAHKIGLWTHLHFQDYICPSLGWGCQAPQFKWVTTPWVPRPHPHLQCALVWDFSCALEGQAPWWWWLLLSRDTGNHLAVHHQSHGACALSGGFHSCHSHVCFEMTCLHTTWPKRQRLEVLAMTSTKVTTAGKLSTQMSSASSILKSAICWSWCGCPVPGPWHWGGDTN